MAACLFADNTALLAGSEKEIQRVVGQFHSMCSRRRLKVNAGKSRIMVFERKEIEMVNYGDRYRVSVPKDGRCEIVLGDKRIEM